LFKTVFSGKRGVDEMKLFRRNKKGSLSLSMEAIVILIFAVVMLGLGLTFVRTMFGSITGKARNAIDIADLAAKPSEGEPITFSPLNPNVKEGEQIQVQVGFYNPSSTNSGEYWLMRVIDNTLGSGDEGYCGGITNYEQLCGDGGNSLKTMYNDKSFKLAKDKLTGWNLIFDAAKRDGSESIPVLLTISFCEAEDDEAEECEEDGDIYQRELFITVKK